MDVNESGSASLQGFRLAPQQARLWHLGGASGAHRAQCAILLEGPLDRPALRQAVERVVDRHQVLRTALVRPAGLWLPLQVMAEEARPVWGEPGGPGVDPGGVAQRLAEQGRTGIDLESASPLRLALVRLAEDRHLLLVTLPALAADTLSLANLFAEIGRSYEAVRSGAPADGDEVVQYLQFSEWQNELLGEEEGIEGRKHWQERGVAVSPVLPFERDSPPEAELEPARFHLEVDGGLADRVEGVARDYESSPGVFWLACLQVLLWRLADQPDPAVRVGFDGRRFEDLRPGLGLFARSLPVQVHCEEKFSFAELLRRAELAVQEAALWQDAFAAPDGAGLSREVEAASIAYEYADWPPAFRAGGLAWSMADRYVWGDPCKLKVFCSRRERTLSIELLYDSHRLAADFVSCLARQLRTLGQSAAATPDALLCDLDLLPSEDRQLLLRETGAAEAPGSPVEVIHELFERCASTQPEAPALVFEDVTVSYGDLNARANRLAHRLRRLGVGPEVPVGLCLERSVEMVVALLGVLKAGGAYVPLDPALPPQRLAAMMEEVRLAVVVTRASLPAGLSPAGALPLCLDDERGAIEGAWASDPPRLAGRSNLAYILFTSGSTGSPKGVAVEHRQLIHYLCGVAEVLRLPEGASYALVSTFAADLGNTVLFPALCGGGCLHLISQERTTDAEGFAEYGSRHVIDCLKIVPSHLRALLLSSHPESALPRKLLVVGGEACGWDLAETVTALAPGRRILNHYGPTETTVGVLTASIDVQAPHRTATPPLGLPLAGSRVYLLDDRLRLVPPGIRGEIYIGGDGLTRGYLGRSGTTAERFVPDPWSPAPGARMYRTGDVGRSLADGRIEFLGRVDHQVKLRGFRIELGEIETLLRRHPLVREALAVLRTEKGEARLVAYVVPSGEGVPGAGELRRFLAESLPEPMVPSAFVLLEAMPLTANGKVDRGALPAPEEVRTRQEKSFVPPRVLGEEILADLWAEVLQIERIGVQDNFFDLGGHSLLGTQLVSRIRRVIGIELPLRWLFEAPTVAGLAARIEQAMREREWVEAPPIVSMPRSRDLPLSFAQEGIWVMHQMDPESAAYNVPAPVRISGPLDTAALERSLHEVIARHEVLRTAFVAVDGQAVQRIAPVEAPFVLPWIELSELPEPARAAEVERLATAEARRPFDLDRPPLLRASLLRLGPEEHALLLTLHHIVSDAWSKEILFREIATWYGAFIAGLRPELPALPIQYADFACWQREWLQGDVLQSHLDYWLHRLKGAPETLALPIDHPRVARRTYRGAFQSVALSSELTAAIQRLSRAEDCTPFMVLLAGLDALLRIYSGQEDIVVGIDVAGRNRLEVEGLIGCFVNNLALRADLSGRPMFRELLRQVRETTLEAYAHQDMPFERVVKALKPKRELNRTPFLQVVLAFQNTARWSGGLPGLSIAPLKSGFASSKWDLVLFMGEREGRFDITWGYSTDLFDPPTIERMAHHLERLLEQAVAPSDVPITALDLLSEAERTWLLAEVNATALELPAEDCVHHLFEAHAARAPQDLAVVFEDRRLTYGELDLQASRWALHLRSLGVGPEVRVALLLGRSLEAVVALLAVLKAGGAYVPLDPIYPAERIAAMLADAGAGILITVEEWRERASETAAQLVLLDRDGELRLPAGAGAGPETAATAGHLAYVLFTSGSTGRPKGVGIEHRQLLNYVQAVLQRLEMAPGASYATVSTLAADLGNTAIFPALCSGGTLHVISAETASNPDEFAAYCRRHPIDCLKIVPSHFSALLAAASPDQILPRQRLVLGGEAASPHLVERLRLVAGCRVVNHYGPTETTVGATTFLLEQDWPGASLPLGRPLANIQVNILSPDLVPLPPGSAGELCISGAGVARGYIDRPELTAERFLPCPNGSTPGARLYRTGDLVRLLSDGNLEFLGRVDAQVKLHGFRIEPGEVEAALRRHPEVDDAVVALSEQGSGDRRLAAWVIPRDGSRPSADDLRAFLAGSLPEYMVPAAFQLLAAFPLTPNGKIDRRALPTPDSARDAGRAFVAPRSRVEEVLAGIWAQILKREQVGADDNFFELGGDSILMIQAIALAGREGLRFTLRQFTDCPTISALAAVLELEQEAVSEEGAITGPVPLTPNQLWFFAQRFADPHHWNQALSLEVHEAVDHGALAEAFARVVAHHDAFRLRFHQAGESWTQIHAEPGEPCPLLRIDLSLLDGPQQQLAGGEAAAQAQASLDLSHGPLLRAALFDRGPGRPGRLLMIAHQLVIDGFGWRVLEEDVTAAYRQLTAGEAVSLPPKTTSFQRWSERMIELAAAGTIADDLGAWLALPAFEVDPLPVDFPEGDNLFSGVRVVSDWLTVEETEALLQQVPAAYRTQIDDVLLAALVQTFAAWTGMPGLAIDLQSHGRDTISSEVDVSRTLGWFTTYFPVYLYLEQPGDPGEALKSIKEQLRSVPERGLGFRALMYRATDPRARALGALQTPEVRFNYQGQFEQTAAEAALFAPAHEPTGLARSPRSCRSHLLDVHGRVSGRRLQILWRYNERLHRRSTVEELVASYMERLRVLIAHCTLVEEGSFTPSDFPLAGLDQTRLERLARKVGQA